MAAAIAGAAAYTVGVRHMLHLPLADIWQHLAAIHAITEQPLEPRNPFVESTAPSRLFGPLWVVIGLVSKIFGLDPVQGFWLGGVLNLTLLGLGIWLLGSTLYGGPRGAVALFAAMVGGWLLPPNFTGYHNPLTLLSSAAYPAITAVASSLVLWALCLRELQRRQTGAWIPVVTALAFITHPLGMTVGLAGSAALLALFPDSPAKTRLRGAALILLGIAGAAAWPYFNPWSVALSAFDSDWRVGIDFYNPYWIFGTVFPAVLGFPYLLDRRMRPFLALLILTLAGFALGATEYFVAGHRLLSWIALILQIGLAGLLLDIFSSRSRVAIVAQGLVIAVLVLHSLWTWHHLERLQEEARREGSLLNDATAILRGSNGRFAGHLGASFPIAAMGTRVLATPFAEPVVPNMPQRQAQSRELFLHQSRAERIARAKLAGVRYLVVDVRTAPATLRNELASQSVEQVRHGNLVRYRVY